jgi:hypothetical protein
MTAIHDPTENHLLRILTSDALRRLVPVVRKNWISRSEGIGAAIMA